MKNRLLYVYYRYIALTLLWILGVVYVTTIYWWLWLIKGGLTPPLEKQYWWVTKKIEKYEDLIEDDLL